MTSDLPKEQNETIVINTGPLIAISKMGIERAVGRLPFRFVSPSAVHNELIAGRAKGHRFNIPGWLEIITPGGPHDQELLLDLDIGEAAVIQLATDIDADFVCIDERKARQLAREIGIPVVGSLGLLGRLKRLELVDAVAPYVRSACNGGIFDDEGLITRFLDEMGEPNDW